jgi:hypothetical protein
MTHGCLLPGSGWLSRSGSPSSPLSWATGRGYPFPRIASRLLRFAFRQAHARNQNILDDQVLKAAVEQLTLVEEAKS